MTGKAKLCVMTFKVCVGVHIGTCQGEVNSLEKSASPWPYQVIGFAVSSSECLPTALARAAVTTPIKHSHRHNLIQTEGAMQ